MTVFRKTTKRCNNVTWNSCQVLEPHATCGAVYCSYLQAQLQTQRSEAVLPDSSSFTATPAITIKTDASKTQGTKRYVNQQHDALSQQPPPTKVSRIIITTLVQRPNLTRNNHLTGMTFHLNNFSQSRLPLIQHNLNKMEHIPVVEFKRLAGSLTLYGTVNMTDHI